MSNYIADSQYNGTLERVVALALDTHLIPMKSGGFHLLFPEDGIDTIVDSVVSMVKELPAPVAVGQATFAGHSDMMERAQDAELEGNARLMAAAPELLAALRVLVLTPSIMEHLFTHDRMALKQARDAIGKATT